MVYLPIITYPGALFCIVLGILMTLIFDCCSPAAACVGYNLAYASLGLNSKFVLLRLVETKTNGEFFNASDDVCCAYTNKNLGIRPKKKELGSIHENAIGVSAK